GGVRARGRRGGRRQRRPPAPRARLVRAQPGGEGPDRGAAAARAVAVLKSSARRFAAIRGQGNEEWASAGGAVARGNERRRAKRAPSVDFVDLYPTKSTLASEPAAPARGGLSS